jgi:hypothetical protein
MLITLMDDSHKLPVPGRYLDNAPVVTNRVQGVGGQFKDDDSGRSHAVASRPAQRSAPAEVVRLARSRALTGRLAVVDSHCHINFPELMPTSTGLSHACIAAVQRALCQCQSGGPPQRAQPGGPAPGHIRVCGRYPDHEGKEPTVERCAIWPPGRRSSRQKPGWTTTGRPAIPNGSGIAPHTHPRGSGL